MYNKDRKELYMATREDSQERYRYYARLFRQSERFEELLGKDLCEFTAPEIENMLKTLSYESVTTCVGDIYQYGQYGDWCLKNGFIHDGQNHFREFDRNDAARFINKEKEEGSIITRAQLEFLISQAANKMDGAILLSMFEGIDGKEHRELVLLKKEDIHDNNGDCWVRTCDRDRVDITKKLYDYLIMASEERTMFFGRDDSRTALLEDNDYVFRKRQQSRGSDSIYQRGRTIYLRAERFLSNSSYGDITSLRRIRDSGIIWYTNMRAEHYGMKGEEYVRSKHFEKEVKKQYPRAPIWPSTFLPRYGKFLR